MIIITTLEVLHKFWDSKFPSEKSCLSLGFSKSECGWQHYSFPCCTWNHDKYKVKLEDKNLPARSGEESYSKNSKFPSDKHLKNPPTRIARQYLSDC